jgi:hypothetical protein
LVLLVEEVDMLEEDSLLNELNDATMMNGNTVVMMMMIAN